MATPTTNYAFLKPATGETYDVNLLDNNYDKIDQALGNTDARVKKAVKALAVAGTAATWGTVPTVSTSDFDIAYGSLPLTSDASGYVGIDMGATFPNGYFVVALLNGDVAAQPNIAYALSTGIFTNTASRFYIKFINPSTGAAVTSATARINYAVIGW